MNNDRNDPDYQINLTQVEMAALRALLLESKSDLLAELSEDLEKGDYITLDK